MNVKLHVAETKKRWIREGVMSLLIFLLLAIGTTTESLAATFPVKGKVTDSDNQVIPGVNIVVKGTSSGTTTDANGEYAIELSDENSVLIFSFIGYTSQEIAVQGRSIINVTMAVDVQTLSEVVVVGYGKQDKENVISAVATTAGDQIVKSPVSDLSNSLVGRVSGVISIQRNAEPGEDGAELLIRGRATLNDNSPLIMVDGIQRDFSQIDPNEIASVSVLKDAAATAIYGVRGANGVLLVTTKRGNSGKPQFSYTGYVGIQNPTRIPEYLNSYDYARLYNEAAQNDNPSLTPEELPYSADDIQKYKDHSDPYGHPDVSWYKEVLEPNAVQQRHSLSMTGGTDKTKYFVLLGYFDQKGIIKNIDYQKINLRTNLDIDVTKTTKFSLGLAGELGKRDYPGIPGSTTDGGIFSLVTYLPPNAFPIRNEDGTWASLWGANPIAEVTEAGQRLNTSNNVQTSFTIDQNLGFITKGLSFKLVSAFDFGYNSYKDWYTPYRTFTGDGEEIAPGQKPRLYQGNDDYHNTTFETHLSYERKFGKHSLNALVLYTQSAFYSSYLSAYRENYNSAALSQLFAGPLTSYGNDGGGSESGREGVVGRVSYQFDERYLLETTFAYNGSENFPRNHRYGFFPGASVGWNISNERFFENISAISNLKLRASYGEVGNDKVGYRRFLYKQPVYFSAPAVFGGSNNQPAQTVYPGELANPNVTWERAKKTNFGLDVDVKGTLLGFTANLFYENRNNILAQRQRSVPDTFGASLPVENIASVNNKGIELELRHSRTIGDLNYFISANVTITRNKIVFIDEPANVPSWRRATGRPLGQFFGFKNEGFYQTQEEIDSHPKIEGVEPLLGEIKYKDISGDGVIDANDITAIGKSNTPQNIFGLTIGGSFKGFDLNMLWQGASGYSVSYASGGIEAFVGFLYGSSAMSVLLDRWTPETPNASFPRLSLGNYSYKQEDSDFWLHDAAYLRLRNIELGYTFPKRWFPENSISKLRLYVSGSNQFTLSKVKIFDPEAPSGFPWFYPVQKMWTVGVNLSF